VKESLRSPGAYKLFLRSARWIIAIGLFTFTFIPAVLVSAALGFAQRIPELVIVLPMILIMIPGAAAGTMIFFGMFSYLITSDPSSSKPLFIIIFLVTAWYGAAFHFFRVYRKQMKEPPLEDT